MANSNNNPLFSKGGVSSHPLINAAHSQGQNVLSHITSGEKTGSGLTLGGASAGIVGPGGTKPTTPQIGGNGGATAGSVGNRISFKTLFNRFK